MFEFMDLINEIINRIPIAVGTFVILKWMFKILHKQEIRLKNKMIELKLAKSCFHRAKIQDLKTYYKNNKEEE